MKVVAAWTLILSIGTSVEAAAQLLGASDLVAGAAAAVTVLLVYRWA